MKLIFLSFISSFLFVTSCGNNAKSEEDFLTTDIQNSELTDMQEVPPSADTTTMGMDYTDPDQHSPSGTSEQIPSQKQQQIPVRTDWSKKIIKTARMNTEVKDFKSFSAEVKEKVKRFGGYISGEEQNSSEFRLKTVMTLKVPVDQFDNLIDELTRGVEQVIEKEVVSQDVTSEYVDAKSRLEAKKQVRLRYLELLHKAKNMSEILEVQKEINEIQEEIEMVTGRINYLSQSSAMSTIHFTYYQVLKPGIVDKDRGFLNKFKNAIVNGWYWTGEVIVGLAGIWPLFLLFGALTFYIRKKAFFIKKA